MRRPPRGSRQPRQLSHFSPPLGFFRQSPPKSTAEATVGGAPGAERGGGAISPLRLPVNPCAPAAPGEAYCRRRAGGCPPGALRLRPARLRGRRDPPGASAALPGPAPPRAEPSPGGQRPRAADSPGRALPAAHASGSHGHGASQCGRSQTGSTGKVWSGSGCTLSPLKLLPFRPWQSFKCSEGCYWLARGW